MRLKVLGSSSAGNCYILENEQDALLIECGVNMKEIKKGLDFNLAKVSGCIISHEDGDHSKSVKDVMFSGITVYATFGTHEAMGTAGYHRARPVVPGYACTIGNFSVLPFKIKHDAKDPVGYIIRHDEIGNTLFLTDTYYVEHTFPGLNNIIVEANYCKDILDANMQSGKIDKALRNRILESHMSIQTCQELLKANDLSGVNNIVLIHLSNDNSNAEQFHNKVRWQTGKTVHIANKGMVIENFNRTPF